MKHGLKQVWYPRQRCVAKEHYYSNDQATSEVNSCCVFWWEKSVPKSKSSSLISYFSIRLPSIFFIRYHIKERGWRREGGIKNSHKFNKFCIRFVASCPIPKKSIKWLSIEKGILKQEISLFRTLKAACCRDFRFQDHHPPSSCVLIKVSVCL